MAKYWFARQFPLSEPKATRVGPVSTEGLMVVTFFAAALIAGAAGLLIFTFAYHIPLIGIGLLFGFGLVGLAVFMVAVAMRSDHQHTVAEYKSGQVRQP